jgi:hypothetical protein
MKIHDLLDGVSVIMTNEEANFVKRFGKEINLKTLDEHNNWVANNLVRKGVYTISKDRKTIKQQ